MRYDTQYSWKCETGHRGVDVPFGVPHQCLLPLHIGRPGNQRVHLKPKRRQLEHVREERGV